MWIVFAILSVVFTALGLCLLRGKKAVWASFCAVALTALTMRQEYALVAKWILRKDWAALEDVVPSMFHVATGYVILMLLLNGVALVKALWTETRVQATEVPVNRQE